MMALLFCFVQTVEQKLALWLQPSVFYFVSKMGILMQVTWHIDTCLHQTKKELEIGGLFPDVGSLLGELIFLNQMCSFGLLDLGDELQVELFQWSPVEIHRNTHRIR